MPRYLAVITAVCVMMMLGSGVPQGRAADATLSGSVTSQLSGQAQGVAGVIVKALVAGTQQSAGGTTTDASGAYSLALSSGSYDVTFTAPSGSGLQTTIVPGLEISGPQTLNVVLVPQVNNVSMSGTLLDASGVPVAGAYVEGVETGLDGSFTFTEPQGQPGGALFVQGNPPVLGLSSHWEVDFNNIDFTQPVVLRLPPVVTLSVRVLGSDGLPAQGAGVGLAGPDGRPPAVNDCFTNYEGTAEQVCASVGSFGNLSAATDANGVATFPLFVGMPVAGAFANVSPPQGSNYEPTSVQVPANLQADATVQAQFSTPIVSMSGTLLDASGVPVAGAYVEGVETGLDGSFTFTEPQGQPGGALFVQGNPPVLGLSSHWEVDFNNIDFTQPVVLRLPPVVTLSVRVLGSDGLPAQGAGVGLAGPDGRPPAVNDCFTNYEGTAEQVCASVGSFGNLSAATDANGVATFPLFVGMPVAGAFANVSPPQGSNYEPTSVQVPANLQADATVQAQFSTPIVSMSGTLLDASGVPVAGAYVEGVETGLDGSFTFTEPQGQPGGALFVQGNPPVLGLSSHWEVDFNNIDFTQPVVLRLPPVVTLSVRVLGSDGLPAQGAGVGLAGPDGRPPAVNDCFTNYEGTAEQVCASVGSFGNLSAATDANGVATFPLFVGMPVAGAFANVSPPQGSNYEPTSVQVPANLQADATVLLEFAPLQLAQSIAFDPLSDLTYGDANLSLSAAATSGLTVAFSPTGSCHLTAGAAVHLDGAGTCSVTASQPGGASYLAAPPVTRTFKIAPASLAITADDATTTYGVTPALSFSLSGFVNGETSRLAGVIGTATCSTSAPMGAGTFSGAIACLPGTLAAENYTFNEGSRGTLTVEPAPLLITASSPAPIVYGNPTPTVSASYSGFVLGNTAASLTALPICSTGYSTGSTVGSYSTNCSGASAANYNINYTPGSIIVRAKPLVVTANDKAITLGAPVPNLTATISGFVLGQTLLTSGTTGAPTCATTAISTGAAGNYPITCAQGTLSAANYSFPAANFLPGTLHILYGWNGFLQPINDTAHFINETLSVFNAGSTVPVKFQLLNAAGQPIQAAATPQWLTPTIVGTTAAPINESTYTSQATTGTTFSWDATGQQYMFNWKTPKDGSGDVFRIGVKLDDSTTEYVNIGLR